MSLTFNNEAKVLFKKQQLQTLVTSSMAIISKIWDNWSKKSFFPIPTPPIWDPTILGFVCTH